MRKIFAGLFLLFVFSCNAHPITITVTNCASDASTIGSLPWAIASANLQSGTAEVAFNIPGSDAGFTTQDAVSFWQINITSPLMITHNGVYVHGSTQTTNVGDTNPKGPEIEITKGTTTSLDQLIKIQSVNYCTIEGLALNNSLGHGIQISYSNKVNIFNNYIGTTVTGEASKPNALDGIYIEAGDTNKIGGLLTTEGNVISGNTRHGINIYASTYNTVVGNKIGTGTRETAAVGNSGYGIYLISQSYSQTFESNVIANNGSAAYPSGAYLTGAQTRYNSFLRNRFFSNNTSGITLADTANENLEPPTIITAESYSQSGRTYISGEAAANAYLDLYWVDTSEAKTSGEGKYLLGSTEADASGNWLTYINSNLYGKKITALQTDSNKNTSQFAANKSVVTSEAEYRPDCEIDISTNESDYIGANIINSSGFLQTKTRNNVAGQTLIYLVRVKNMGSTAESIILTATPGNSSWEAKYYNATSEGTNITAQATNEGYVISNLGTGEASKFRLEARALISEAMTKNFYFTARSTHEAKKYDVVCATAVSTLPASSLSSFAITFPSTCEAGVAFLGTIEAKDATGTATTDVRGWTTLTIDYGTISPSSISASEFADDGKWAGDVTLSKAGQRTVSAANSSAAGTASVLAYNGTTEVSDPSLGVTIVVPSGAASSEVSITITELSSLPGDPPSGMWQAGKIIGLTSDTSVFSKPITITLPLYSGTKSPKAYYWTDAEWSLSGLTPISNTDTSITFYSTHLTTFVPFSAAQAAQFIFGPSPYDPSKNENAYFWYWLNKQENTSLLIFDISGNLIYKREFAAGGNGAKGGLNTVEWNGKDNFGDTLKTGTYLFRVVQGGHAIGRGKFIILKN